MRDDDSDEDIDGNPTQALSRRHTANHGPNPNDVAAVSMYCQQMGLSAQQILEVDQFLKVSN